MSYGIKKKTEFPKPGDPKTMPEALIVKVEIIKGPRPKQELVSIHSHDRSIDVERPLDEMTQSFLGNSFKGYLDDLRVYKKTLDSNEVQTLYNLEGDSNTCLN